MIEMHVCHTTDVIEGAPPAPKKRPDRVDLREECLGLWSLTRFCQSSIRKGFHQLRDMELLVYYAIEVRTTNKRTPMDVPHMIEQWKVVIVTLCTAHDKDDIDKAEFRMDELLKPLLTAPVAQLREFYSGLTEALRADKAVPFFIWSIFKAWGTHVLKEADDKSKVKRLRRKLAEEIADLVDEDIKPDITAAVVGALMWRDPESLEQIKADLQAGAKPRLRGRESCLFLVTQRKNGPEHTVML